MVDGGSKLQFRPRARIIRTICDQLISGPEAAVIELVKNSYDADASQVIIKFHPPLTKGVGMISIADDGSGMTLADIEDKWMEPATVSKVETRYSPVRNRTMMGSKGIGRFAAAKLGRKMSLLAVSDRAGSRKEVLIPEIDWSMFDDGTYLSDISIEFLQQDTEAHTGTRIEISSLNEDWSKSKLDRLYLELRRLVPPEGGANSDFRIFLDLSLCTKDNSGFEGSAVVADQGESDSINPPGLEAFEVRPIPLLTSSDYELRGQVDEDGSFSGVFVNRRAGRGEENITELLPLEADEESCGPFSVHLHVFDREADVIKETMRRAGMGELSAAQARNVLNEVAGVAIYRNGFRVRPYGDAANDWLTLDRRRVQNPSLRIGHNQVAGYIAVADQETSNLIERSSREGFEENEPFQTLKNQALKLLSRIVEPRRYDFRVEMGLSRAQQPDVGEIAAMARLDKVRKIVPSLPASDQQRILGAIEEEAALLSKQLDTLETRQRALESVATLGGIVREIIHEGTPEVTYLAEATETLQEIFPDLLQPGPKCDAARKEFPPELTAMSASSERLRLLFEALTPLAGGRRIRAAPFNPVNVIREVRRVFQGSNIPIEINNQDSVSQLFGFSSDFATALNNLINNSVFWLKERRTKNPRIDIGLEISGPDALISVQDNGGGIPTEFADSVFDVGFSLKEGGTGLGLNIAKETLGRSGATIELDREAGGGAKFLIRFPRGED